jgi:DeoR family transcriptional regulator, fructose operon transcriptional repressor
VVYAEERQQAIAELVLSRGRLSVLDLAATYGVTTETVRRDLSVLERAGVLRRVHGGAVPVATITALERAIGERDRAQTAEKDRIAAAAAEHLPPAGGSVVIDAGTTTARVCGQVARRDLTVMTHSVTVAARLAGMPQIELHLLPGQVRPATQAAVGEATVAALGQLRVDVAFLGTNGISLGHGLSTPDHGEAACKRAIVAAGQRTVVLADATKLGMESTVRFAELADVDVLVTDRGAPVRLCAALRERGVEVVRA